MEIEWNLVINDAVNQALRIFIPVLVALIGKWAMELYLKIRAEKPKLADVLDYCVEVAVQAAEQVGGTGEEKKGYALAAVANLLEQHGICVEMEVISTAIENEVFKMNRWRQTVKDMFVAEHQEPSEGGPKE